MASRSPATSEAGAAAPMTLGTKIRAWRRIAAVAFGLVIHVALHELWRLFRLRSPWPRSFLWWTCLVAGIDVRVRGKAVRRNVLYVANHTTWFDIPVIAGANGARFVSKDEVARWPWIGWLATMNRTVFIARAERGQVARQAEELRVALGEGTPVCLFPEGGTGDGVALRPFRASLFSTLYVGDGGIRVQPISIDYNHERTLIAWTDKRDGFGHELFRLMGLPGRRKVTLSFLDPLDPAAFRDRKALAAAAEIEVGEALGLRAPEPV
jgi:lyso-ornithine lipid O-acyltransferase